MEYHSDKFHDHSIILYFKEKPAVIFPAHQYQNSIYSHNGLSFGGFLSNNNHGTENLFRFFRSILHYYSKESFTTLYYKKTPLIYQQHLAQSDEFFLFQANAKLENRETNLVIPLRSENKLQDRKKRAIQKSTSYGISVTESDNWDTFWEMLTENLQDRHKTRPVHTISEILKLKKQFTENIRLFMSQKNEKALAGTVLFIHPNVVHSQYIASTEMGRETGAVDFLFKNLIEKFNDYNWFSLGVSSLRLGGKVNKGLTEWKEGFGAQPFSHDNYLIDLTKIDFYNQVYVKAI